MSTTAPALPTIHLWRDLVAAGWRDQAIARMVEREQWVRVRHGAYVDAAAHRALSAVDRHRVLARAVLKQGRTDLVLSHTTGVRELGIDPWDLADELVHVTRTDGRIGRTGAGVRQHGGRVVPGDVVERNGVPVMNATRVGIETTMLTDVEHAVALLNQLCHAGLTDRDALAAMAARAAHWPESLSTDLAVRLVEPRCESVAESRSWYLFWSQHLPMPVPQFVVTDAHGRTIARLDFAWPELGVFAEFDGRAKYGSLLQPGQTTTDVLLEERRRESRVVEATGWRCIRLTWSDLAAPERTASRIRRLLFPAA
ncbi:type IV toxin-antitoxin system AbiEi family antitoxin domain-containing protein [Nocardioides sp. SYSU D00038]|uniref:type IV toxin-antitoxin system AbiEi family antitoxin domain-containing protein n=1 Tax=Nocardioides sp. SYSU D00038 TaxID=2812554 RepID=UPI001967F6B4|nr:type IV toxin-antitoxin system AbiEi family antitoxin domain-containing protein [Nocardioides sp. SYSU D00038]